MRRGQAGLTGVEFAVVIALLGLLIGLAADQARRLSVRYERASLEYAVHSLRAAVALRFAQLAMSGELARLPALAGANPMHWLERPLPGYRGEHAVAEAASLAPGSWYFEPSEQVLVYVVRNAGAVRLGSGRAARIRYRVSVREDLPPTPAAVDLRALDRPLWSE